MISRAEEGAGVDLQGDSVSVTGKGKRVLTGGRGGITFEVSPGYPSVWETTAGIKSKRE